MEYIKAFHIDNGRKYYSLTQLTDLVDVMARAGYNMLELAVGNDGVYYNQDVSAGILDKDIVVSYWSPGWDAYDLAPVSFLEARGHQILDTNCNWYYVLGRTTTENDDPIFTYQTALNAMQNEESPVAASMKGKPVGSMFCLWSDEPKAPYDEKEVERMHMLLRAFKPKH